jgi:uncharacterized protein (TIGR03086 family)
MTEIADRYRRLSSAFTTKVEAIRDDQWDLPTPCEQWTVRDLVRHIVDTQAMFEGFVGRDLGEIPAFADDPKGAWAAARDKVRADLDDPALAQAEFDGLMGRSTFEKGVDGFLSFDQVVHGWDLARAIGQDERIEPAEVSRIAADVRGMGDTLRSSGACGPAIEPPPDADPQTRLLCELGRRV